MYIQEVCNKTNLTKKAIEYYQVKNLISPMIEENGYRVFSEEDIVTLNKIKVFRDLNLSVLQIEKILTSNIEKEELKKAVLRKEMENEINNVEIKILYNILDGNEDELLYKNLKD